MKTDPNAKSNPSVVKGISPNIVEVMEYQSGLTKREYFAGLICASLAGMGEYGYSDHKGNAEFAVGQADALIEALNKD